LLWGDVIEDFLEPIGVSLETFRNEMTGGWAFGYIESLNQVGVETELVCVSRSVTEPVSWRHKPTGAGILMLPQSRPYRLLRSRLVNPYAWSTEDAIGGVDRINRPTAVVARHAAPYFATPVMKLARHLRHQGHAALLCQEYEYPRFDVCTALGALLRVPVFATFQGGDYQVTRLERKVRPLAMRACNGLIVGSSSEVDRVRDHYRLHTDKIACIFNPFDISSWPVGKAPDVRRELGITQDERVVVWHGRIELHRKGLDVLCHAWQLLQGTDYDRSRHLVLVGNGADAGELRRRIASLGLQRVHWIEDYVVDRRRIQRYLSAADIYVFPSRHEGFPVAPIEAMASGLPVVATDAPGILDIFTRGEESGGVVIRRGDGRALALALERIIDGPDNMRRELGQRARHRAEVAFAPERVGGQIKDFLLARGVGDG
jgi:glycosyltransferase involved in cell wall biosynthesis